MQQQNSTKFTTGRVLIWILCSIAVLFGAFVAIESYATMALTATAHHGYYPTYPKIDYGTGPKAKLIKRGEYLVKLGDCIACHSTHNGGKAFAGGLAIKTPFGTIYTPNITPDKKYGIGSWTQAQFDRAMHDGISPKGYYYYPAFPYLYFNTITKKDLVAIKAYLDAIPAVAQKNKKNTMKFPFNIRFLQLGWRILFFYRQREGYFKSNPLYSKQWNRGKYIVQGLGHCSMCHSPSYYLINKKWSLAAPIRSHDLTGAFVQGFYAPDLTGKTVQNSSIQQIADVFKKGTLLGGGKVQGPMAEANHDSLKYLKESDILAIAAYLKNVPGVIQPKKHSLTGSPLTIGKQIVTKYCSSCHSAGVAGAPKIGSETDWDSRLKASGLNGLFKNAINGINAMPPKGTCQSCTDTEIQDAVTYMLSQSHIKVKKALGHDKKDSKKKK